MKILWVEDFGGGFSSQVVVVEMFKDIIPQERFDLEYDTHLDVEEELPRLFEKYSFHQLYVCKSYVEWETLYQEHGKDFDLVLLDINLESYKTPSEQMPQDINSAMFDEYGGFYIYHRLIKDGFPDENIAFFTGYDKSLEFFSQYCNEVLCEKPKNAFEKTSEGFKDLRTWLYDKLNYDLYLILRRGIIDGCRFLKNQIKSITSRAELEQRLLFYKTTTLDFEETPEIYISQILDYLSSLESFFALRRPSEKDKSHLYFRFVKELSREWERSYGYFRMEKTPPRTMSRLEDGFCRMCQAQMKLLRNWSFHELLVSSLTEQDLAFFFLLAMRSLYHLDFYQCYRYEKMLSDLFLMLHPKEAEEKMSLHLEQYLSSSYKALEQEMRIKPDFNAQENYFVALLHAYGQQPREHTGNLAESVRREIRSHSVQLLYQAFWHGLFSSYLQTGYGNALEVHFDIEPLPVDSFPYFLGRCIFRKSFES